MLFPFVHLVERGRVAVSTDFLRADERELITYYRGVSSATKKILISLCKDAFKVQRKLPTGRDHRL